MQGKPQEIRETNNTPQEFVKYTGFNTFLVDFDDKAIAAGNLYTNGKLRIPFIYTLKEDPTIKIKESMFLENKSSEEGYAEKDVNGVMTGRKKLWLNQQGQEYSAFTLEELPDWFKNFYEKDTNTLIRGNKVWEAKEGERNLMRFLLAISNFSKTDKDTDLTDEGKSFTEKLFKTVPDFKSLKKAINLSKDKEGKQLGIKRLVFLKDVGDNKSYMNFYTPRYANHYFNINTFTPTKLETTDKKWDINKYVNEIVKPDHGCLDKLVNGFKWTKVPTDWKPGTKVEVTNPSEVYQEVPINPGEPEVDSVF